MGYLLGYDIGSSSIKATLIETETGEVITTVTCTRLAGHIESLL